MAIKGNFETFFLGRILRGFADDSMTGILQVNNDAESIKIILKDGDIIYTMGHTKQVLLGELLKGKGIITDEQLTECLEESKAQKKVLGTILVEKGYIPEDVLKKIIKVQTEEVIFNLFLWETGEFEFKEANISTDGLIVTQLNIMKLILKATRRIEKMSIIEKQISHDKMVFQIGDHFASSPELDLSDDEKLILGLLNGQRNVKKVIADSGNDKLLVYKILYTLISSGIAEVAQGISSDIEAIDSSDDQSEDQYQGDALKKKILRNMKDLPPMPKIVHKARQIMANSKSSFKEIGSVIETDPAIAVRVLRMANSAYYGLMGTVSSIQHAAVVLGFKTLSDLITVASASNLLGKELKGYGLDSGDLWRHSMGVAFVSKFIATRRNPKLENDAFSAGLIHDAGKIVLDRHINKQKEAFMAMLNGGSQSLIAAEKALLGFDHPEIAAELCKLWNIPESQAEAICYHHTPEQSQENELAYILYLADATAIRAGLGHSIDGELPAVDGKVLDMLGLDEEALNDISQKVSVAVDQIAEELDKK